MKGTTMSLNVNFDECKPAFEKCDKGYKPEGPFAMVKRDEKGNITHRLTHTCRAIVGMLMGLGMGRITGKTVNEFTERSELWQDVIGPCGPGWCDDAEDEIKYVRITPEDIRNHIGLASNVSKETNAVFYKKLRGNVKDRLWRLAQKAAQAA